MSLTNDNKESTDRNPNEPDSPPPLNGVTDPATSSTTLSAPAPDASRSDNLLTRYEAQFTDLPMNPGERLNKLEIIIKKCVEMEIKGYIASITEGLAWKRIKEEELYALRMIDEGNGKQRPMKLAEYIASLELPGVPSSTSSVYKAIEASDSFMVLKKHGLTLPRNLNQSHLLEIYNKPEHVVVSAWKRSMETSKGRLTKNHVAAALKAVKLGLPPGENLDVPRTPVADASRQKKGSKTNELIENIIKAVNEGISDIDSGEKDGGKTQFLDILRYIAAFRGVKPEVAVAPESSEPKNGETRATVPTVAPEATGEGSAAAVQGAVVLAGAVGEEKSTIGTSTIPTSNKPDNCDGFDLWTEGDRICIENKDLMDVRGNIMGALGFKYSKGAKIWMKVVPSADVKTVIDKVKKLQSKVRTMLKPVLT